MHGSPVGIVPPISPGSKYCSWAIFDGALTSVNVPKKPNCLPSSWLFHCQRYVPPTRTSISHTGMSQPG